MGCTEQIVSFKELNGQSAKWNSNYKLGGGAEEWGVGYVEQMYSSVKERCGRRKQSEKQMMAEALHGVVRMKAVVYGNTLRSVGYREDIGADR